MRLPIILVALLTMEQALSIHCRLQCLSEGEYGGEWSVKEKACLCLYIRQDSLPINAVIKEKLNQN